MAKIFLSPVPPYDFALSAGIFSGGDRQIRFFENGQFSQVIRVNSKLILVRIRSTGSIDAPRLEVDLAAQKDISYDDEHSASEILSLIFNINLDLNPFYFIARQDKVMLGLTQRLRGLKSPITATPLEALTDSIIEQQISLKAAHNLEWNVTKKFGESMITGGETYYAFPLPERLYAASTEELRRCGLSSRKAEYLHEVSGLVIHGKLDLEKYRQSEDSAAAIRELDAIRGIGVWTAELTLVRGLGKLDAIPADDIGLRRVISHYYFQDRKINSEEARQTAEKWGEWKGLASFYLVMAEILKIPKIEIDKNG